MNKDNTHDSRVLPNLRLLLGRHRMPSTQRLQVSPLSRTSRPTASRSSPTRPRFNRFYLHHGFCDQGHDSVKIREVTKYPKSTVNRIIKCYKEKGLTKRKEYHRRKGTVRNKDLR